MESDEREVSGYNGRESKTSVTAKYDEIKNTIRLVANEERSRREAGEKQKRRGRDAEARESRAREEPGGSVAAGGLTRMWQHTQPKNQHRRRQITTHIIRSCRLPSRHESFVRDHSVMYDVAS